MTMQWYEILTLIGFPALGALILGDIYARIKLGGKKFKQKKNKEQKELIAEVVKAEVTPIKESLQVIGNKINTLEEGECSSLRNDLLNSYRHCEKEGYRTTEDTQNWSHMYEAYKKLNGNSFIDTLKTDFDCIDTYDEYKKKLKNNK